MMRIWIFSALGVGALVAIVLIATAPEEGRKRRQPDLTEGEVQIYVRFVEMRHRILTQTSEIAAAGGRLPKKGDVRAKLARESLELGRTLDEMNKLVRRVQDVVDGVRWEENPSVAKKAIEDQIALLQSKRPVNEQERGRLEDEIDGKRRRLDGPRISANDRALVKKHWRTLNRLAPRTFGQ